jgi:hypothetical protein
MPITNDDRSQAMEQWDVETLCHLVRPKKPSSKYAGLEWP